MNTFKTLLLLIVISSLFSINLQDSKKVVSEKDFNGITLLDTVSILELKDHNESWELLKKRFGGDVKVVEVDEFVEQVKNVNYEGTTFRYSDYGAPGDFTLTNITITNPDFYIHVKGKELSIGDEIEEATSFSYSINETNSTLTIKIYVIDEAGNLRYQESGDKMVSENMYLTLKFDSTTRKIIEINFTWRIV